MGCKVEGLRRKHRRSSYHGSHSQKRKWKLFLNRSCHFLFSSQMQGTVGLCDEHGGFKAEALQERPLAENNSKMSARPRRSSLLLLSTCGLGLRVQCLGLKGKVVNRLGRFPRVDKLLEDSDKAVWSDSEGCKASGWWSCRASLHTELNF